MRPPIVMCFFPYRSRFLGSLLSELRSVALDRKPGEKKRPPRTPKCAHSVCSCMTTLGKYCSAQCGADASERSRGLATLLESDSEDGGFALPS
jgi:hypothetical protein